PGTIATKTRARNGGSWRLGHSLLAQNHRSDTRSMSLDGRSRRAHVRDGPRPRRNQRSVRRPGRAACTRVGPNEENEEEVRACAEGLHRPEWTFLTCGI